MNQVIRLAIPDIKCNGCVEAIEKAFDNQSGVIKAEVDLQTRTATVESNVSLAVLVDAIKASGFDATELATETRE
jgi:copper chaperone CopZ